MPDQVATSLQHIVRQMDILTQTMSILEVYLQLLLKMTESLDNE